MESVLVGSGVYIILHFIYRRNTRKKKCSQQAGTHTCYISQKSGKLSDKGVGVHGQREMKLKKQVDSTKYTHTHTHYLEPF